MSLAVGTILAGRYRILSRLGEGGMGSVYQAEDLRLPGRLWAVKELLGNAQLPPEELTAAIKRFDDEIALLARLSNPRIPGVADRFVEHGHHYFVMDFIPGTSLEERLAQAGAPLSERQVLDWSIQVCDVLAYIHAQQPPIILRDLKPGNIMVTPRGEVRLIDFGIARTYKPGQRGNTENLGTMVYASPEHLGQTGQTDARSDIYSLGATLYHLLTNREPVPMETPYPGALRRLNSALSEATEGVVVRAMQLDPLRRYQTATEMAAALRGSLARLAGGSSAAQADASRAGGSQARPAGSARAPSSGGWSKLSTGDPRGSRAPTRPGVAPRLARVQGGVVCPHCGHLNRTGARFCARDGVPLPGAPAANPPPVVTPAPDNGPAMAGPFVVAATAAQNKASAGAPRTSSRAQVPAGRGATLPVAAAGNTAELSAQRGAEAFAAGRYAPAARQLELAIAQGRATYETYVLLGRAYRQLGRPVDAASHFERAGRLRPTAEVFRELGLAEREAGRAAQAQVALTRARQLDPQDPQIAYQLGLACLEQGLLAQAEGELEAVLQLRPNHAPALLALGRVCAARHHWEEAGAFFRRAVTTDPSDAAAYLDLGRALLATRRLNEATRTLEEAVRLAPESAESHTALGMCYHAQGKRRQARAALRRATELDPHDEEAQRLLKQL
jgi:tetratricopeptide (TPR) repeat protein